MLKFVSLHFIIGIVIDFVLRMSGAIGSAHFGYGNIVGGIGAGAGGVRDASLIGSRSVATLRDHYSRLGQGGNVPQSQASH